MQTSSPDPLAHILYLQSLLGSHNIPFTPFSSNSNNNSPAPHAASIPTPTPLETNLHPEILSRAEVERYSRQMLLKQISYSGQIALSKARVAIVGCGGIGCPLAMYLASAGVGTLGLFDSDVVEVTNLHRQIGHRTSTIGMPKNESLAQTLIAINPHIGLIKHPFVTQQTMHLLQDYDLVMDGSDNPKCRYLVNDYCMKIGKPLISGACIGWEAQITAYGKSAFNPNAPCYRCLWGDQQVNTGGCSTRGVLGMLPGLVGMLVGVQAIKFLIQGKTDLSGSMVLYDGLKTTFKKIKLRNRKLDCKACGDNPLDIQSHDYEKYGGCSITPPPQVDTVTWQEFVNLKAQNKDAKLLDVRSEAMFGIVSFKDSTGIALDNLRTMDKESIRQSVKLGEGEKVFVSCRRGNDSRRAVEYLQSLGIPAVNVKGGIEEYGRLYDPNIPNV